MDDGSIMMLWPSCSKANKIYLKVGSPCPLPLAADSFKTDLQVGQVPSSLSCHPDGPPDHLFIIKSQPTMLWIPKIVLVLSTVVIIII